MLAAAARKDYDDRGTGRLKAKNNSGRPDDTKRNAGIAYMLKFKQ